MSEVKRYTFLGAFGDRGIAEPTELVLATDFDATEAARVNAEEERDQLRAELAALKAQQVGQEPVATVTRDKLSGMVVDNYNDSDFPLGVQVEVYTTPQPAPAQDVAGLPLKTMRFHANKIFERVDEGAKAYEDGGSGLGCMEDAAESALYLRNTLDAALAAHDKQSGGEV